MGGFFSMIFEKLFSKKEVRIVMVGLDGVGKTTILYKLKLDTVVSTIPTIGFNVETLKHNNITLSFWDLASQDKIRPLWRHYCANTQALILVIDSTDKERIDEAKRELEFILGYQELQSAIFLVMANKQDVANAMTVEEIESKLGLRAIKNREWHIEATSAVKGTGLVESLDWLTQKLEK